MSEINNDLTTIGSENRLVDEIGSSLFYRMTHRADDNDADTNVPIENVDANQISIVGDTYDMCTDVVREPSMSSNKYAFVYGNDLLAKMSELSMAIEYDQEYREDYIRLYHLLTSIVTKLP